MKKIFLGGITGASGALYGKKLIEELSGVCELHICITPDGLTNINLELETDYSSPSEFIESLGVKAELYDHKNFAAPVSSGSFMVDAYIIAPASMGFVGRAAGGISSNLIERCADVAMKERRDLIILYRETPPLSLIHMENLTRLTRAGAVCMPASPPGFYHSPKTIDDLISFVVGKIFDIINIQHNLYKRWEG